MQPSGDPSGRILLSISIVAATLGACSSASVKMGNNNGGSCVVASAAGGNSGTAGAQGGTGNTAGALGTNAAGGARAFPTQVCLDQASAMVAMMTDDEKIAQLHQIERANVTAANLTQYDLGSVYSQGGSAPAINTPTGWADMVDGFRTASFASRLGIPIIYGLDVVHGVGPVKGATVFPHNIGLGATRDPALV